MSKPLDQHFYCLIAVMDASSLYLMVLRGRQATLDMCCTGQHHKKLHKMVLLLKGTPLHGRDPLFNIRCLAMSACVGRETWSIGPLWNNGQPIVPKMPCALATPILVRFPQSGKGKHGVILFIGTF